MGHAAGKDLYRKLGSKIDNLTVRAPWNEALYTILSDLYTQEEAEIIIKMPYGLSTLDRISKIIKYKKSDLQKILERLCAKGLVMDIWIRDTYYYLISPMIIGIFEYTMMRTGNDLNTKKWAKLFHEYLQGDDSFFAANFKNNENISIMRALPHEETIDFSDHIEILDYEKAESIVMASDTFSIGLCSCRHEKYHIDEKKCDAPLEGCSSFGKAADYLIRNNLAKEVSKSEMLENIAQSKELGLVLNADNVQKNVSFICHCCKCCCNALLGISKHGFGNIVITSSFIAKNNTNLCIGCGKCAKACPIDAIKTMPIKASDSKKKKIPEIDESLCLGCGVCALQCQPKAMKLVKRKKRVIHPETTFERVILQCLERGTLQYQLFTNPQSITQQFMRGFVGGFLKLNHVKKALLSDTLRSTFLTSMKIAKKL